MTVDPDRVHDAHQWVARWIGPDARHFNHDRAREFIALAISHEPDATLRIAQRLRDRQRAQQIDTSGT